MSNTDRIYFAVSIKHSHYGWKMGKPLTLWGGKRTADTEKRCFSGYTCLPDVAELYSISDWENSGYTGHLYKIDAPLPIDKNLCSQYKRIYDTVLILAEDYFEYCSKYALPTDLPY